EDVGTYRGRMHEWMILREKKLAKIADTYSSTKGTIDNSIVSDYENIGYIKVKDDSRLPASRTANARLIGNGLPNKFYIESIVKDNIKEVITGVTVGSP